MVSRDTAIARAFHILRLDSVKYRIVLFAVVATLLPALATTWLSYAHNKRALTEKTTAELLNASALVARETNLWLKERFYDVRVFASSYEVSENLERVRGSSSGAGAKRRLASFLDSVRGRFAHYEALTVFDMKANAVATSGSAGGLEISRDWLGRIRKDQQIVGDTRRDAKTDRVSLPIVVPVRSSTGKLQGGLAAKLNLNALDAAVGESSFASQGQIHVLDREGNVLVGAGPAPGERFDSWLDAETIATLVAAEQSSLEYENQRGEAVLGTLRPIPGLDWIVSAEVPVAVAYSQITELREQTAIFLCVLLVGIGLIAYILGVSIARPLNRLTEGAARVAEGDLDVTIASESRGELGYLTRVFNDMVERLRVGREELERLSITDNLTGLFNRKHLGEKLDEQIAGARDKGSSFSILMIDVDHFKAYNDSFGHLAGDEVLSRLGELLAEQVPSPGFAARYGGEEFCAVLPGMDEKQAARIAESLRLAMTEEPFCDVPLKARPTLSVGVAAFEPGDETPETIISAADRALYQAKRKGRNRVTRAGRKPKAAA